MVNSFDGIQALGGFSLVVGNGGKIKAGEFLVKGNEFVGEAMMQGGNDRRTDEIGEYGSVEFAMVVDDVELVLHF